MATVELCEDCVGGFGPDEWLGVIVVLVDISFDGGLEVGNRGENAALKAAARQRREEALDGVEPRGGRGREVEHPSRMAREPGTDFGVFVGGVVVGDGVDDLARRGRALDGIEEADELLMGVSLHAAAEHGAVEDVQRRKQRRGAVALVVMGHGAALAGFERQAGLGAVQGLDLRFFVDLNRPGFTGGSNS